jgi:processive 1,2-diacylglycerol beta-glucosyltransferase
MFNRVLILTVDIGGGHMRAAQALEKVFYRLEAARDVRIADAMQYTSKLFWRLFERAYRDMVVNAPHLYGWLYERSNAPGRVKRPLFYEKLNARPIRRLLEEYRPELVISTHVVPAGILSWTKEKEGMGTPHAIVITDFDVHVVALCGPCDHYFVALEETQAQLEALGVAAGNITAAGIPIDPAFLEEQDKAEARRQLGLEPDLTTILVTSGSWGLGPVDKLVQAFQGLQTPAQFVAICGRNERLKRDIQRIIRDGPRDGLVKSSCIGWTDRMHVYMSAADLVAGKTGGLTASEALVKGLPFFVVNPLKGQEEQNATHLLEEGAALRCNNLLVAAYKVDRLLHDPRRLARMAANARRLGRPCASFDIVRKLLQLQHHPSGGACSRQRNHGTCSGISSAPADGLDPGPRGSRAGARPNEPSTPGVKTGSIRRCSGL